VLPTEPPPADEPLLRLPNVVCTNHIAWYSDDSTVRLRQFLAERCAAYLVGRKVASVVNAASLGEEADTQPDETLVYPAPCHPSRRLIQVTLWPVPRSGRDPSAVAQRGRIASAEPISIQATRGVALRG